MYYIDIGKNSTGVKQFCSFFLCNSDFRRYEPLSSKSFIDVPFSYFFHIWPWYVFDNFVGFQAQQLCKSICYAYTKLFFIA